MVGVPKSNGCATCRKRSIKCDEIRPACKQCRRGGRECPGYVKLLKFVDEGAKLRSRRPKPVFVSVLTPYSQQPSHLKLERAQIVATFLQDLFPLGPGPIQQSYIGGWLLMVPTIMHQQSTLDLAAESLACAYLAKNSHSVNRSSAALMRGCEAYSKALANLSRAVQHPKRRLEIETLCAILLLALYERFSSFRSHSWISHAQGMAQIIKIRGPARHTSGIGHAFLTASRGYIIAEALVNEKSCFLEHESWQTVHLVAHNSRLIPNDSVYHIEGLNYFAQVPGLVQRARALTYPVNMGDPGPQALQSTTSRLRSRMLTWFTKAGIASRRSLQLLPNDTNDQRPYYQYDGSITASFAVNHCAYLILVNNILDLLSGYCSHGDANRDLAIDINLSASYCFNTGFCGAQAMMLTLPIALTALPQDDPAHAESQTWLERFEDKNLPIKWNPKILDG